MKSKRLFNVLRIIAIVLLLLVSLNALAAGYSFITDPSGKGLGINKDYLKPSAPFSDYLIPGIFLFAVNGILSSIIAVLSIIKVKHYPLLLAMQGTILVGWIAIQLTMVTMFHPLHLIIAAIGFFVLVTGFVLKKEASAMAKVAYRHQCMRGRDLPA